MSFEPRGKHRPFTRPPITPEQEEKMKRIATRPSRATPALIEKRLDPGTGKWYRPDVRGATANVQQPALNPAAPTQHRWRDTVIPIVAFALLCAIMYWATK